jgi:histidinol-phosphate aminotransferase
MSATQPQPRPGIAGIQAYVGGGASLPGVTRVIKLSSNEGALGPSPKAIAAYGRIAADLHRYPEGDAGRLRQALAEHWQLDAAQIVCGNGSDDLLQLLTRAYAGPGDEVLHSAHGFAIYPISAQACGATPVAAPETALTASVDQLLARVTPQTRILFLANPNNPTGTYLPASEVRRLHAGLPPSVLLVLDAAYAEFVTRSDYEDGAALVRQHDNVVMTRTFSKIYALGGLRLGWAYCPPAIAHVLNLIRGPFNVAAPALAAGEAALHDTAFTEAVRRHNDQGRAWLADALTALGLQPVPGVGNFLLVGFPDPARHSAAAADAFLRRQGIIVRAVAGYGLPDHLRITIGRDDELQAVQAALAAFVGA